jgi:predicted phage tail component-like protein
MRVKETAIDGVDGSIIEELGYESYDKTITVALKIGANIDEILEYFTGNGELIFSNEPNKYYNARIINSIDYERLLRYRTAKVTFRVQPFKYDSEELEIFGNTTTKKAVVVNIGNHTAKPLIRIEGAGMVELSVNNNAICRYVFPDDGDTVILDSEKQDAYLGNVLKNRNMVGEFPIFEKGDNIITWSGEVENISIMRYSRWL